MPVAVISIITPVLNGARYIAQTAQSILSDQPGLTLEWIVVDGGSTDGTLDILSNCSETITADSHLKILPDRRRGQSAAINLGLKHATAPVLAWLGADDLYVPGALAHAVSKLNTPNPAWLIGHCEIINPTGRSIRPLITRYKSRHLRTASGHPSRAHRTLLAGTNFISQPAVFFNRAILNTLQTPATPLDESLHFTMDYDLWLRLWQITPPSISDAALAKFRLHPHSKSGRVSRAQFDEQLVAAARYIPASDASLLRAHRRRIELIVTAYKLMRWLRW